MKYIQKISLIFLLLLVFNTAKSQTDTIFWFAAPEVSIDTADFDRPIFIRLSAFNNFAFATLSQPANPAFIPQTVYVPAFNTVNIDLTSFIDEIENKPADSVLNYGISIRSTEPITAYYEVASTNCNCDPEIFTIKGSNALGLDFIIPTQTVFANNPNFSPIPKSSFDIVATEKYTVVTITPSSNIIGHPAGVPFTVNLNAGQTYSATASSIAAAGHLAGSIVSSNKPIAITIKDDLVTPTGEPCADLMGDQIVPISVLGYEYVGVRGFLNSNVNDRIFVTGTKDNTDIFLDGNATPAATINTGQVYTFELIDSIVYINTSEKVYVLQISGFGCEMGMAQLPPIDCTGSVAVSFTRTTSEYFGAILIVNSGAEGSFILNGNPTLVQPSAFFPVPGTGGNYVAASLDWSSFVPLTNASLIQNSVSYFHIGVINGGANTGCRFGYFSNYSNLNLGADQYICPRDSVLLDAGSEKSNVLWSTGETTTSIMARDSGNYWVIASLGNCTLMDSIYIGFYASPDITLGPDTAICEGTTFTWTVDSGYIYEWADGSTGLSYTTGTGGDHWVIATDTISGCSTYDTVYLHINPMPIIDIGPDTTICSTEILPYTPGSGYHDYLWQDGSTDTIYYAFETGIYYVEVKDIIGCTGWDTATLLVTEVPYVDFGYDTIFMCNRTEVRLEAGPIDSTMSYIWQDGSSASFYIATQPGDYWVVAGRADCYAADSIRLEACTEFWMPNAFTPNGDGLNDEFFAVSSDPEMIKHFSLLIYNRWGGLVFQTEDISMGWDGTFKGKDCPVGVYHYVVTYEGAGNVQLEKEGTTRGHVTLFR